MILLTLKSGWPDRVVAWNHTGPVPDGHMAVESIAVLDEWKAAHPELTPQPEPVLDPVPEEVTLRQFLMAADRSGLLAKLEALKTSDGIPQQTRRDIHFFLEYSNFIERGHPLIAQLAPVVGVTESQINDLFRAAAAL